MKRIAGKKSKGKLLTVWVPQSFLSPLNQAVKKEDSDYSKFIRNAIREKLARRGMPVK